MKTRDEIIHDMCVSYRSDYELRKSPADPPWLAGMTDKERQGLRRTMATIFDNNILPLLKNETTLDRKISP